MTALCHQLDGSYKTPILLFYSENNSDSSNCPPNTNLITVQWLLSHNWGVASASLSSSINSSVSSSFTLSFIVRVDVMRHLTKQYKVSLHLVDWSCFCQQNFILRKSLLLFTVNVDDKWWTICLDMKKCYHPFWFYN